MITSSFAKTLHNLKKISGLLNVLCHPSRLRYWWFIALSNRYCYTINWVSIDYSLWPYIIEHLSSLEEVPYFKVDVNCFHILTEMVSKWIRPEWSCKRGAVHPSTRLKPGKQKRCRTSFHSIEAWQTSSIYFMY